MWERRPAAMLPPNAGFQVTIYQIVPSNRPKPPKYIAIGYFAPLVIVPLALLVAVKFDGLPRIVAIVILGIFAVWFGLMALHLDPLAALENDWYNKNAPWFKRNEDIGKTAVAIANFVKGAERSRGKVNLDGEIWDAVCMDDSRINEGAEVHIIARESLTLVVSSSEEQVPRDI